MPRHKPLPAEMERERLARTVACPTCGRPPGQQCYDIWMSHTSRYNIAAAAGLVPALRPIPTQQERCTCH
jgi:hypothetical protein